MMGEQPQFSSLRELVEWAQRAPLGTSIPADIVARLGAAHLEGQEPQEAPRVEARPVPLTWRERLWLVPAETRVGPVELCEALGRSRSWLYKATSAGVIPHRKLDGDLYFVVGEVRAWLRDREETIVGGPMESAPWERGLYVIDGAA